MLTVCSILIIWMISLYMRIWTVWSSSQDSLYTVKSRLVKSKKSSEGFYVWPGHSSYIRRQIYSIFSPKSVWILLNGTSADQKHQKPGCDLVCALESLSLIQHKLESVGWWRREEVFVSIWGDPPTHRGQGAGDRGHHNMNGRRSVVREYHVLTSDKVMLTFQIKSPATATALVGF